MKKHDNQSKLESVSTWYTTNKGLNSYLISNLFNKLKNYIKEPVLEIGAADGFMTKLITNETETTKLDIVEASSHYCRKLSKRFPELKIVNSYFEKYKTEKKYSTIIASHILEHVKNVREFLDNAYDLLEPKGRLLITVPNALSFHRLLGVEMKLIKNVYSLNEQDKKIGHFRVYSMDSLKTDL